jgi:anthranilate/para-aminobenzoate synthase component I
MDTNIAIRTCVVRTGRIYFSGGGGIVADSDPEHEYRETLHKVQGIVRTLARRAP